MTTKTNYRSLTDKFLSVLVLMLMLTLPISAQNGLISTKKLHTKEADITKYAQPGAVPEVMGKVVFERTLKAGMKSKDRIYTDVASFASLRYQAKTERGNWRDANFFRNLDFAQVTTADRQAGLLIAQGAEELIFSNKFLSQDYSEIYYLLTVNISDGSVKVTMSDIAYVYRGSDNTSRIPAEDWITDKEALNKEGNLRRISGKFRVKTIDLFNELCEEIQNMIK